MKKILTFFAAMALSISVNATQFKQGEHYDVIDGKKSSVPTVTELFSFYCGHCYKFESFLAELKTKLPKNVKFQKSHVSFLGGEMGTPMAKAYATMVVLKVEDQMIPYMFNQVHRLHKAPQSEQQLRQIFLDNGVDAAKFDAAYNGFAVDSMQRRFDKQFSNTGLTGVPGVVVNNKYVVKTTHINSYNDYIEVINYLLTL